MAIRLRAGSRFFAFLLTHSQFEIGAKSGDWKSNLSTPVRVRCSPVGSSGGCAARLAEAPARGAEWRYWAYELESSGGASVDVELCDERPLRAALAEDGAADKKKQPGMWLVSFAAI